jgi:D-sedoheptulose 7-phosphate isomerase
VSDYSTAYLKEAVQIIGLLDTAKIEAMVGMISELRTRQGRIFFLGVGGSAANAAHAVNDFRKLLGIECYAPTDNVAELTARANDQGWDVVFEEWLKVSRLSDRDMLFILSVGGGSLEPRVSPNIVRALDHARKVGARIVGIVGRDGGHTAEVTEAALIVPTVNPSTVTPHAESFQAVIWHLIVSHPVLRREAVAGGHGTRG